MPAQLEGNSVLIVDDDPDILSAVQAAFTTTGATVRTATDGNRAVEMVKNTNPDLVILDMMLPRRSGFLVMETIKPKHDAGAKPFVIMITANEGKRHEQYAKYLGVSDYVSKPFRMERLLETASRLLGGQYTEPEPDRDF